MIDKRIKLKKGDRVRITPEGRRLIQKESRISISNSSIGVITNIRWDIAIKRHFVTISLMGKKYDLYNNHIYKWNR